MAHCDCFAYLHFRNILANFAGEPGLNSCPFSLQWWLIYMSGWKPFLMQTRGIIYQAIFPSATASREKGIHVC